MRRAGAVGLAFLLSFAATIRAEAVRGWEEPIVIPTYPVVAPDVNPHFRVPMTYQGAAGRVYPYAFQDKLSDTKEDKSYRGLFLENEYVKICVLPESAASFTTRWTRRTDTISSITTT